MEEIIACPCGRFKGVKSNLYKTMGYCPECGIPLDVNIINTLKLPKVDPKVIKEQRQAIKEGRA